MKTNSKWDAKTARALAIASDMAYGRGLASIPSEVKYLDATLSATQMVEVGTSEVLFIRGGHCTIIAFRGSDEIKDWMRNLDIRKINTPEGALMRGFEEEVRKVYKACAAEIVSAKKVYITGHSKGGGTGVNFLNRLRKDAHHLSRKVVSAYFFGCPRSMDSPSAQAFDKEYSGRVFRVINNNDVVCRVPSSFRWQHVCVPDQVYIDSTGTLHHGPMPYLQMLADRIKGRWVTLLKGDPFDGLYDHFPMIKYVRKL